MFHAALPAAEHLARAWLPCPLGEHPARVAVSAVIGFTGQVTREV